MAKQTAKRKLDTMSITVLLVMAIFGGIVGFVIGQSTGKNLLQQEQAMMMQDEGKFMQEAGKAMMQWGKRYNDKTLTTQGTRLEQDGSMMMQKATMMGY